MIRFIIFFLLLFTYLNATPINKDSPRLENFKILYLNDESSQLNIQDISQTEFKQEIPSQFALGYHSGTAWFKITLHNTTDNSNFVLYFTEPFWSELNLYSFKNGKWVEDKNGLEIKLQDRSIEDINPAFFIKIKEDEQKTFYVKGKTVSSFIGEFQVYTLDEFFKPNRISLTDFHLFYSGILIFILLLVSFLFSIIRDKIYIYYIAYVSSFIIWISTVCGSYLLLGLPSWDEGVHATGTLVILFLALFSITFLELKSRAPKIYKMFKYFAFISILFTLSITLKVPYTNLFFNVYASSFFIILLFITLKAWRQNYAENIKFYLLALLIYMPGMALMTLTFNGLVPNNDFTRYLYIAGSFTEIIFFSYILFTRYDQNRNQKLLYQNELLTEQSKTEQYLENAIKERTQELQIMNTQLQKQAVELEETKAELTLEASTDSLSQLYNRRYFINVSQQTLETTKRYRQDLSLCMLDIDHFKNVNDTYGHEVGDKVIIYCSDILKKLARQSDIVTRYGGEEFIILLPQTSLEDALALAQRIRKAIYTLKIPECDKNLTVSISIGVTQVNHEKDENISDIIQRADKALYIAKEGGRNRVESLK